MSKSVFATLPVVLLLALSSCTNTGNNNNNNNNNVDSTAMNTNTNVNVNSNANDNAWQSEQETYRTSNARRVDSLRAVIRSEDSTYKATHKKNTDWDKLRTKLNNQIDSLQSGVNNASVKTQEEWDKIKNKAGAQWDTINTNWQNYKSRHLNNNNNR
jgi:hypothetical protein